MHIGLQAPEETCFTWSNLHRVSSQFNQEPSWLPIYRHLAFPRSVSLYQITHESKHHRDWKTLSTKFWSRPHLFSYIPSSELQTKKKIRSLHRPLQLHGPANSSIELLPLPSTLQQSETNWMNVCPILTSATDSLKNRNPKKIFPIPRKPQILKKILRINIITNISKPSIKSSVNGFRQIS